MGERLLSVGLDVGTTTTQLIVSRLTVQNRASAFAVPDMHITGRQILYESPVHFTPLLGKDRVDGQAIGELVRREYQKAGITQDMVDTGAVIITGETSRKENAAAVLEALSGLSGEFVVATAGPDLESVLAAKGAGAVDFSERTGKTVLHMDIGGGTSNLALIENGKVIATGCLNVGGRLVKIGDGKISYVSSVVKELWAADVGRSYDSTNVSTGGGGVSDPTLQGRMEVGEIADVRKLEDLAQVLVQALEMAAGLREKTALLDALWTKECAGMQADPTSVTAYAVPPSPQGEGLGRNAGDGVPYDGQGDLVISFSGGVADCIEKDRDAFTFGDMGPVLGRCIRKSRLCQGAYMLGKQTIRATVIGAGCHSAQLSGSTVFCKNVTLPLKNLPVAVLSEQEQADPYAIAQRLTQIDGEKVVLAMPGYSAPSYEQVGHLAQAILEGCRGRNIYVCLENDMAKALGQRLCLLLGEDAPCLCIDRVRLTQGSYLDVGQPVGPCLPVVVKTLILNR